MVPVALVSQLEINMATITLSGPLAATLFNDAAARTSKEAGPISQNEKRWSRWGWVVEQFGEHEVTIDLDTLYLMLVAGAKQK